MDYARDRRTKRIVQADKVRWTERSRAYECPVCKAAVLYMLLPQRIAYVVKHLTASSEANTALELAQAVLRLRTGQGGRSKGEGASLWCPPADPLPRLAIWDYDSFLLERVS